jgi:adenylyltransferase/sulfurtransferase
MQQITAQQLAARLTAGEPTLLLDVRQPWEHETAALPNSVLVPLPNLPACAADLECPAGALLVTYCHHGVRSLSAAHYLEQIGYENVASLAGGIDAWSLEIDKAVPRY